MTTSFPTLRRGSDYAALGREIKAAGLLDRRPLRYAARLGLLAAAYAGVWTALVMVGSSWYSMVVAVVMGVVFTQIAFLGHDAGHQQVFRRRRANDTLGMVLGNLLVGLSYGWWLDKHNRHHSHPNHEGRDPDIGEGVLAFTTGQVASRTGAVGRFLTANQAWFFFPLLLLEGVNLHVASAQALLRGAFARYRRLELVLFAVHLAAFLTGVLIVLAPIKALVFVAIQEAVFGLYMGCSFAPNHKGMPTIAPATELDFLRRQVLTSRNVRGGWWVDQLFGGLNYQIEHHLFPSMPRPNLRAAQRLIREYCRGAQLPYTETTAIGSYAAALRHLHSLGAPLRGARRVPVAG